MNNEEFQSLVDKIVANRENQALVTELATQLKDGGTQLFTNTENLQKQMEEYDGKIEELQKANLNLYLKVGQPVTSEKVNDPEPLQYEDLINELGGNK